MLIFIIYKGFFLSKYFLFLFVNSLEKLNDLTKTDYFPTNRKNSENEPQSVKANDSKTNKIRKLLS